MLLEAAMNVVFTFGYHFPYRVAVHYKFSKAKRSGSAHYLAEFGFALSQKWVSHCSVAIV